MKKYIINPESNQIVCNTAEEAYKAVGGRIDLEAIRGMENEDIIFNFIWSPFMEHYNTKTF